jgi:hypothetical protein
VSPAHSSGGGEGEDRRVQVQGPNACAKQKEAANERNPSPLIPLPIGLRERDRRQFIGFMPLFWSFDSPHVGCYIGHVRGAADPVDTLPCPV